MSSIEIVSHCFNGHLPIYAPLLRAQGLSLIHFSRHQCKVTWTICYHASDIAVLDVLDELESALFSVGVLIRRIPQSLEELFQRSIGRNIVALSSKADCVWFCDCDYLFKNNCLDSAILATARVPDAVVYPQVVLTTTHETGDRIIGKMQGKQDLTIDDIFCFYSKIETKAIGGIQIVNGDLARSHGYVNFGKWIKPTTNIDRGAFEFRSDVKYRGCIGKSSPQTIDGAFRVRHSCRSYGGKVVE